MTRQEREIHDLRVIRSEHRRALLAAYKASLVKRDPWWAWMLLGASLALSIALIVVAL